MASAAGTPAKEAADEADAAALQRRRAVQVNTICAHMGLNVANLCVVLTARPVLLGGVSGLSTAAAAQMLALFSSGTGLVEFLMNPIAGKLSDAMGRRAFLLQAPAVSCLTKLLVLVRPSQLSIALERIFSGACTTIGGSTACSSSLADIIDDPAELGRAYASLGVATGLGVVLGPIIGAFAIGRFGNPRRAFAAGAALSALQLALVSGSLEETLAPSLRRPLGSSKEILTAINPLSVLSLFTNGRVVATLVSTAAIQCFCEGKSLSDTNTYYLLNEAKFSDARRSVYISSFGFVMTLAGVIGRKTIQNLGMRGHTTLQNIMSAIGFSITGSSVSPQGIFGALVFYAFAMERRAAVTGLAVKAAASAGMGKGEFAAAFANLRALAVGLAPLLFARAYASGLASQPKSPGRPYYAAALFALLAELLHRTLGSKELEFK
mmetsp:Transcript_130088/g.277910  ORF Transcript_130088/g.277910 Transcript_130088/m.277910 type:complete len:437 (-) Transcript_130088:199-1509(-)